MTVRSLDGTRAETLVNVPMTQENRRHESIRDLIQEEGHPVYHDEIEVHLTDLETQEPLVKVLSVRATYFFDRPHVSPFTAVEWDGWVPRVRLDARWYELVSLNDIPVSEIVTFCQREYEANAKKRFGEDLERVLIEMGAPAEDSVALVLRDLESQEISTKTHVAMTHAKRQQVWRYNNR